MPEDTGVPHLTTQPHLTQDTLTAPKMGIAAMQKPQESGTMLEEHIDRGNPASSLSRFFLLL